MEKFDEPAIDAMTVDELDAVSGGRIKRSDIHMDYNFNPNEPAPTRYA
jgi:hypothetical protein